MPANQAEAQAPDAHHLKPLDGIRGIAILMVLVAHGSTLLLPFAYGPHPHPWTVIVLRICVPLGGGVDVFFTLSGFLITGILLRSRNRPTYFSSFYARRALRIFPAYYLTLVVLLLLSLKFHYVEGLMPQGLLTRLSYFFYVANWPIFWQSWAGMGGLLGVYWSLNVEEQFYLIWPTLIRFLKPATMMALCLIGFSLGWLERRWMIDAHGLAFGTMQWPFSRLDGLFLGSALAIYRNQKGKAAPFSFGIYSVIAGAAICAWIAVVHTDELDRMGAHITPWSVTAFALASAGLIVFAQYPLSAIAKTLSWSPLRLAGRYSYGMYVYHLLIFRRLGDFVETATGASPASALGAWLLVTLATFGVAALSFHFFESPFLRLKRFFPSPFVHLDAPPKANL
jgi:peptidoglycan/LPS O-acetylase OafA/YrhL